MALRNIFHKSIALPSMRFNQNILNKTEQNFLNLYREKCQLTLSTFSPLSCRLKFNDQDRQISNPSILSRLYSDDIRKKIKDPLLKNKEIITERFVKKRAQFKERKQVLIQGLRDKKDKVKEKVEEIVERENIMTIPNLLSLGRCFLSPYVGYVIVQEQYQLAIGLLVVAGITDLVSSSAQTFSDNLNDTLSAFQLDGFIARTWTSQASKLGSFLDPMADKLLVGSLVISLSYCSLLPIWLSAMVILRDVFLILAGFIIRFISLPPPVSDCYIFISLFIEKYLSLFITENVESILRRDACNCQIKTDFYKQSKHCRTAVHNWC